MMVKAKTGMRALPRAVAIAVALCLSAMGSVTLAAKGPWGTLRDGVCGPGPEATGRPTTRAGLMDPPRPLFAAPEQLAGESLPVSTWMRALGSPTNDFLVAAPLSGDGTITFAGISSITSSSDSAWYGQMDASGATLWQKSFSDSARETWTPSFDYDGGLVFKCLTTAHGAGGTDFLLVKTNPSGDISWQETLGGPGNENGDIVPLSSGGYTLAAGTTSSGAGGWDIWMAKLSAAGALLWQKTFGTTEDDTAYAGAYSDGSFFLAGVNPSLNLWYLRADASGNILWQKSAGLQQYISNVSVSQTSDGNALVSLYGNQPGDAYLQLLKIGSGGEILWQKMYICYDLNLLTVRSTTASSILLAGTVNISFDQNAVWLVMLDASGEVLWQKAYRFSQNVGQVFTYPMADGTTLFTCSFTSGSPMGTWVADVGNQGQIVWQRFYGTGTHQDLASAPIPTADGGLIFSGATQSWGGGQADGWVFKTTAAGEMDPACTGVSSATCTTSTRDLYVVPTSLSAGPGIATVKTPTFAPVHTFHAAANASDTNTLVCSGGGSTCALACTASAPASGTAGSALSFSATATPSNCTGSATFAWTFGDGGTSNSQNPSHTYAAAGTYTWTMTASVQGVTCSKTGSITVTPGVCAWNCSASAEPTNGAAPLLVSFAASIQASPACTGGATFAWQFGDSATAATQNTSHTYQSPGTYTWTLTATANQESCTKSGTIVVTQGARLPGDCDGNGAVSIGEVQKAINMFLGTQAPGCGADCSGDGTVSIGEVQKVINAFLGLTNSC